MNSPNGLKPGLAVITDSRLGTTTGMMINPLYLSRRRPDERGRTMTWVPGHGGDVWFVDHNSMSRNEEGWTQSDVAAYSFTELTVVAPATEWPEPAQVQHVLADPSEFIIS